MPGCVQSIGFYIEYEGLIDVETEQKRLGAEINQKQKSIEGLQSRLKNETFVSKAPEEIINKEKERLNTLDKEVTELKNVLANLS